MLAQIVENLEQARRMQENIDKLDRWAKKWKMEFNVGKCKVIHFGRKNLRYGYTMGGVKLTEAEEEKDLGVWMHSSMKPTMQCEMAAKKANMALGMMLRSTSEQKRH